jgi:hypothetical protein
MSAVRHVLLAAALVAVGALFAVAACMPAGAAVKPPAWSTCQARASVERPGGYRIYDDQFIGSPSETCITSTGLNLTVTTAAVPFGGEVVDAPAIQFGAYYSPARATGLPLPDWWWDRHQFTAWFSCPRSDPGVWWCDAADMWFSSSAAAADEHGSAELVIQTRGSSATVPGGGAAIVRLSGHEWVAHSHLTCHPGDGCWPLTVFRELRQDGIVQRLDYAAFIRYATRRGWIPASDWLDSVNPMIERWSGGRGLQIALARPDVVQLPPVIRPLGRA